ncbi:dTMP kinase [Methanofollis fontis]|uniref:Probable thymidylate kinase n=1 Tax=Methanofollis fontis TaxID=2052832 RepID=A0A483CMX6_9EURY|nr:dTMP kinase [Methanofollis fontis]TAJ43247.1 dTMP kinase [Methanofollis fontis]
MLITIEGIDGSGKSTLVAGLERALADLSPLITREPGATWVGEAVRRSIAENTDPITECLLFVADHAAHLAHVVRPALEAGRIVISDRYSDSRYAYQGVTLDGLFPDPVGWLRRIHEPFTISPDLTFLCVLPVDEAETRLKTHREHFENGCVLEQVQRNYLSFAEAEPGRFVLVDAMLPAPDVCGFVADEIRRRVCD